MTRVVKLALVLIPLAFAGCHPAPPVDPHAVTAVGSVSNRFVRSDRPTPVAARLLITAAAVERAERPPVNLALVVDTSGLMEGRAIEDARGASKALLGALRRGDWIAVVAFGSTTEILLPSTPIEDTDTEKLRRSIDEMKALGTTDMAGGLRAGMSEVSTHLVADGVNRIILLGDGDPNDALPVKEMAGEAGSKGISITALGLGPDYNETLMGEVAQLSGGTFHYVEDSTKVAGFFDAEIVRLNRIYAKNAVVVLTPGPGVTIERVIGQGGERAINIGDSQLRGAARADRRDGGAGAPGRGGGRAARRGIALRGRAVRGHHRAAPVLRGARERERRRGPHWPGRGRAARRRPRHLRRGDPGGD